jgi:hypothetical protein
MARWQQGGLGGWWEALGRGKKNRWQESDWQAPKQWLEELSDSSVERGIDLGAQQVRRILKKNYCWKLSPKAPPTPKPQLMTGCASF